MKEELFTTNFEYYKVFYYVVRYGSISAAAEKLFLSQPSVTKTIQRLETELDTVLFVRSRRGISLTQEGEALWRRVEPACNMLLSAQRELKAMQSLEGGSLSIASTEMSFKTYVIPAVERFSADHPKVAVKFRSALTEGILDMLRSGGIDIAILHEPFTLDESMEKRRIDVIQEHFVVGPRYAFLAEGEHSLEEILDYPIISMPEGSSTKAFFEEIYRQRGLQFKPDIEVTTVELTVQAVKRNLGIGTLPERVVSREGLGQDIFIVPVKSEPLERCAYAITSSAAPLSSAARKFLDEYLVQV